LSAILGETGLDEEEEEDIELDAEMEVDVERGIGDM
jgi:hypothetical protein